MEKDKSITDESHYQASEGYFPLFVFGMIAIPNTLVSCYGATIIGFGLDFQTEEGGCWMVLWHEAAGVVMSDCVPLRLPEWKRCGTLTNARSESRSFHTIPSSQGDLILRVRW